MIHGDPRVLASWERLRAVAIQEVADYLEISEDETEERIESQDVRIRVSVMVWDNEGIPLFDTQSGSLDEHGALRMPPRNFEEGLGWDRNANVESDVLVLRMN